MCNFPSWIQKGKNVTFLTDADVNKIMHRDPDKDIDDLVGHSAITEYKGVTGIHKEGFPCHPKVAAAIIAGKCKKMMLPNGYEEIHVDKQGRLHNENGPAIIQNERYDETMLKYYVNGKLHNENGPAIMYSDGHDFYWKGKRVEFNQWLKLRARKK